MEPLLHPSTKAQLQSIIRKPKGAYIFAGNQGAGRATSASWLAKQLHCGGQTDCQVCHLIDTRVHGDFIVVEPQESGSIGIAQTQELLSALGKSKLEQRGVRMAVIDGADKLTIEAQNSLLKTIEEPPADTMVILVASDLAALLETIKSRSEVVFFPALQDQVIAEYLKQHVAQKSDDIEKFTRLALGSPGTAMALASNPELYQKLAETEQAILSIETASDFERLRLAAKLQEGSVDIGRFVGLVGRRLQDRLREEQTAQVAAKIAALERFERYLKANVNGRSAWSRLLLEL